MTDIGSSRETAFAVPAPALVPVAVFVPVPVAVAVAVLSFGGALAVFPPPVVPAPPPEGHAASTIGSTNTASERETVAFHGRTVAACGPLHGTALRDRYALIMKDAIGSSVPFAPPKWLTPVRIGVAAASLVTLVGALCIGMPLAVALGDSRATGWFTLFTTLVLSSLLVALVLRARTPGRALVTCVLAIPGGICNALLLVMFVNCMAGSNSLLEDIGTVVAVCAYFGGGAGLLFGLAFTLPLAYAVHLRNRPSHASVDRMLVAVALWLSPIALGIIAGLVSEDQSLAAVAVAAVSVAPLLVGAIKLAQRSAWLRSVRAGAVPGWEITPATPEDLHAGLVATSGDPMTCGAVLRRSMRDASGPYRSTVPSVACALVPS